MKKIIIVLLTALLLLCTALPARAFAADAVDDDEISSQIDEILSDYDIGLSYGELSEITLDGIFGRVRDILRSELAAPVRLLGMLLIVAVFTAVMKSFGDGLLPTRGSNDLYDMICVMSASAVITPQLLTVYEGAVNTIERIGGFIMVYVPVFAGLTIATGGFTSGSIYNFMTLAASELFVGATRSYLMPVLSVTAVLAITGSVFSGASVDGFIDLLKKLVIWTMTVAVTLFCGFVTLKCTLAGKADGVATKTTKFVLSGCVPIVGGAVSDAYSSVKGGFEVIRSTVGTAGVIAIVLIMLPPILKIMVFRAVMWAGTAASELLSAQPLVKLMKGIDSGLAIAQSVLVCYSLMFVLCTAILMQTGG